MPICHGHVKIKKIPKSSNPSNNPIVNAGATLCKLCFDCVNATNFVNCISPGCEFVGHLQCVAKLFLEPGQYVPVQGTCPKCKKTVLWGDLIRKRNGCSDLENCTEFDSDESGGDNDDDDDDEIEEIEIL